MERVEKIKMLLIIVAVTLCLADVNSARAKSVYAITDHHAGALKAYKIQGNQLEYQADVEVTNYELGPVDVTVDSNLELLFITYEASAKIVWANAKTLEQEGFIDLSGAPCYSSNLAGIVADESRQRVYVVERASNKLYILAWNAKQKKLILMDPQNPNEPYSQGDPYITLTDLEPGTGAWGITLDENTRRLYVANNTINVHIYDANNINWTHLVPRNVGHTAGDVAVDPNNGQHPAYLYTGALCLCGGGEHNFLVKHNLEAVSNPNTDQNIGTQVVGLAVDPDTGLVYMTTFDRHVQVYNCSSYPFTQTYSVSTGGYLGPAGVCVPSGDVSYKPPAFSLTKNDNVDCVYPYDSIEQNYLVYEICYDANGHTDTNVVITDYLPPEVDYYSSNPAGTYHSDTNTVTWNITTLSGCIQLTVMVNNYAKPGGIITNVVEIEGDNYYREAIEYTNVCCYGGEIVYVDKDATGFNNGTSWDDAYKDLQDALTSARNCGASVTAIWVAAGTYKPTQNPGDTDANFALIEDVGLFGHFPPDGSYRGGPEDRNFADANNETILEGQIGTQSEQGVQYVVTANGVKNALVDGFTVSGSYGSYGAGIFLTDSNAAIVNCKLKSNYEYGAYITNFSYPDIHNCLFINNSTVGIKCDGSSPAITNTIFDGNNITLGGVAGNNSSVIEMSDCTAKNHTQSGIYGQQTDIEIENCCVTDNGYGIYCEYDCNPTINSSVIKNNGYGTNDYYGVYCSDSDLIISHCAIENNNGQGLSCVADSSLDLTNSIIRWNGYDGVHLEDGRSATIKNSWIHNNGTAQNSSYGCGIYLKGQHSQPIITNNTIYDNFTYGIYHISPGIEPVVTNCIVWSNSTANLFREGGTLEHVTYSCIGGGYPGNGNDSNDPSFKNPNDPNDFHIAENSPCKDTGDPNANYDNQTDIDGEDRVKYGRVDKGGDEYYRSPADFDGNDIVNFFDYAEFTKAWQTQNQNPSRSLDGDSDVDIYDLKLFCDDWLWEAGWTKTFDCGCSAGEGVTTGLQTMAIESAYSFEGAPAVKTTYSEKLMLLNTDASLAAMPERLAIKAEKFYSITASPQETKPLEITPLKIEELIKWLEQLWLDPEVRRVVDKGTWLKFIESLMEEIRN